MKCLVDPVDPLNILKECSLVTPHDGNGSPILAVQVNYVTGSICGSHMLLVMLCRVLPGEVCQARVVFNMKHHLASSQICPNNNVSETIQISKS
jgi:hypothetical protein